MNRRDGIPFYFRSKQELLDRLESLRPEYERIDAEAAAKHHAEEKAWLKNFRTTVRARCAELLKLDYANAKEGHRYSGFTVHAKNEKGENVDPPNCPTSIVEILDRAIAQVQRSSERAFRINPTGQYHYIHFALTRGIDQAGAVC